MLHCPNPGSKAHVGHNGWQTVTPVFAPATKKHPTAIIQNAHLGAGLHLQVLQVPALSTSSASRCLLVDSVEVWLMKVVPA
jgi:hypothetical protein